MFFNRGKEKHQSLLSVEEAYHLWDLTRRRYLIIDQINLTSNCVHDKDFILLLKYLNEAVQGEVKQLENLMNEFSIKSSQPNNRDLDIYGCKELVNDEHHARLLAELLRAKVRKQLKIIKDSKVNDGLREVFMNLAKEALKHYDLMIKYMKTKGWLELPPLYPNVKPEFKEAVGANEVFHLWEHLQFRYINIHQTRIYRNFVKDKDFKVILETGIKVLKKQAKQLEDKLLDIGVKLPQEFSRTLPTSEALELYDDKFMFENILFGMQNAVALHGSSIQELLVNDSLRKFFVDLLFEEVSLVDKLAKYGKLKGWVPIIPKYKKI